MEMEFTAKIPHSHGLVKINLSGCLVESYHVTSCAFPVLILLHLIFFLKSSFSAAPMVAYTHHTWYSVLITIGLFSIAENSKSCKL